MMFRYLEKGGIWSCHPSVAFLISNWADTDPAPRLLDGWQEGVVPLVLQKALWSEAETEGEPSLLQKQSRPKPDVDVLGRRTASRQHSSGEKKKNRILHPPSSCHILRSASILMASQHGCLSIKPPLWSFLLNWHRIKPTTVSNL